MNFITKDALYTSSDIKEEARAQLRGFWKSAIFLSIIPVLFSIFFVGSSARTADVNDLSVFVNLGDIVLNTIQTFLSLGVVYTFLDFIRFRNESYMIEPLQGVISAFQRKYILNLFLLSLLKFVLIFLWSLLFIVPGIVKALGYAQAEKIYKDYVDTTGEQPNPRECLKESQELMKGHKLSLFSLDLSFIGWHILSIFTFGIGYIWLTPYMTMSDVLFYENIQGTTSANLIKQETDNYNKREEVGKDPDDFSDFEDF